MSIQYFNDQNNPVKILFDHKFTSELPKLNNLNYDGIWNITSIYNTDIINICSKGIITCKYAEVIYDSNKNILSRELNVTYFYNNILYQTIFYLKIIPRTILVIQETNDQIINKEYDGTSWFNNNFIINFRYKFIIFYITNFIIKRN